MIRGVSTATRPGVRHGTRSGYVSGCHCDDCTDAEADYQWAWEQKRKSVTE